MKDNCPSAIKKFLKTLAESSNQSPEFRESLALRWSKTREYMLLKDWKEPI
jgi:hypothetical protein